MPSLLIYAESKEGVEQTWLVDAYTTAPDGEVSLYRSDQKAPVIILGPDDVAGNFAVIEWEADLLEGHSIEDLHVSIADDEDGDICIEFVSKAAFH